MSSNICPNCELENRPNNKFCSQCGTKLADNQKSGPRLFILTSEQNSVVFQLSNGRSALGRDMSNDIVINDDQVSKCHATIIYENNNAMIEDMNSRNGVYINGKRINVRESLQDGSLIKLGSTIFRFENPANKKES